MSNLNKGINIAKLAWLNAHDGPGSTICRNADGWIAEPKDGAKFEEEVSRSATAEEAAAARVALLESLGVTVAMPPDDYIDEVTKPGFMLVAPGVGNTSSMTPGNREADVR